MKSTLLVSMLFLSSALTAQGAQGVNQGQGPASHYVQGRVVAVQPAKGAGQGSATLRLRSRQKANNAAAGNALAAAPVVKEFLLSANTHFEVARGAQRMPGNAGMLRPGQHVMVQAQGQQALGVRIVTQGNHRGRRGGYHAGRGAHVGRGVHVGRGHRGSAMLLPQALNPAGPQVHHASLSHAASQTHVKRTAVKKGR